MRGPATFASALAVSLCSIAPDANAQPTRDTERFNMPDDSARCTNRSDYIPTYPFSVDRIERALTSQKMPKDVRVLIVDNNFVGYRLNDSDEADAPTRVSSKNFPDAFFRKYGEQGIDPFILDEDAPAEEPDVGGPFEMSKHGTYIAGIVLGGMYDETAPPPQDDTNLRHPNVRRLLLTNPNADGGEPGGKSWIELAFINIRYGDGDAGDDPVAKVNKHVPRLTDQMIVNMSLGRTLTASETVAKLQLHAGALVVTAAGNSGRELRKDGLKFIPAMIEDDPRMLVVASHDANGQLSAFSNYGPPVLIAAPGCQIKSWPDRDGEAIALSGTSMATALVSFAAAMVRSRWTGADGTQLRNRLLASARYEPSLRSCAKLRPEDVQVGRYCVKDGAMLDMEAAVLVLKDFVEYEVCPEGSERNCATKTAIGTLEDGEDGGSFIGNCIANDVYQKLLYRGGLTLNGAYKRMGLNARTGEEEFLVAYEPGETLGAEPLEVKTCSHPMGGSAQQIVFTVAGAQLDGEVVTEPRRVTLDVDRVRRLVTRVVKPQT